MRLLMILALLVASVLMARPAHADMAGPVADCHGMASTAGGHDQPAGEPADKAPDPAPHSCPGCACFAADPAAPASAPKRPALDGTAAFAKLLSQANAPIPPPPRLV